MYVESTEFAAASMVPLPEKWLSSYSYRACIGEFVIVIMVQVLIEVRSGTVIVLRVSTSFLSVLIVLVILCFSNENMNKSFKTCTSMSINLSTDVRTDFSRTCVCDKVCVTVTSALFRIKSVAGYRTARRAGSSWSRLTLRRGDFLKEFSIWMRLRSVICIGKFVAVSISVHEDDADFL